MTEKPIYVAGIDAGGTNTDCAILEPRSEKVICAKKTATTADPGHGILQVLKDTCQGAQIKPDRLATISIGTTHFINAVLSSDASRLRPVALFRLGHPYTAQCPPFCDFPPLLRSALEGPWKICKGGLQISGEQIGSIDPEEIREQCKVVKAAGIKAAVICGVYSPLDDPGSGQEPTVARIIKNEIPDIDVVCSHEVGQVGFLEREAASILNASILHFARITIASFQSAIRELGSNARLFLTRNDGTLCSAQVAARLPICTFASGSTNSLRGAAILAGLHKGALTELVGQIIVADIGGTSTDVGVILKSGFPRPAAAFVEVAGLRTNFSMPDVQSIGIGGGSIVHRDPDTGTTSVGPDSVGYKLISEALCFGGSVPTASDVAIASGAATFGEHASKAHDYFDSASLESARICIQKRLQALINRMKTTPEPATLILVGGGSVIAPSSYEGVGQVIRPALAECANAIGAACARVAGVVDTIVNVPPGGWESVVDRLKKDVIARAINAGASEQSVEVVEIENMPIQYVTTGATRVILKAVGDLDYAALVSSLDADGAGGFEVDEILPPPRPIISQEQEEGHAIDIANYRPCIEGDEWHLSEIDLEWIAEGCGCLGVGGGGSTYYPFIMAREILRNGGRIRVKSVDDIPDDKWVFRGGFMGSPSVSCERLQAGAELQSCVKALADFMGIPLHQIGACMAEEIGGGNGIQPLLLGSSAHLDVPVLDADLQGRAYPNMFQCTMIANDVPYSAYPAAITDAVGNVFIVGSAENKWKVEPVLRAATAVLGSMAFQTMGPQKVLNVRKWAVLNTVSQCWWIGRSMAQCRLRNDVNSIPNAIFEHQSGKILWIGKVISVSREVRSAFTWGAIRLVPLGDNECEGDSQLDSTFQGELVIEFQNEWLVARQHLSGQPPQILAIVPDLITCLDTQTGMALGTHEVRFGLMLTVIALRGDPKWYTEKGLECGGPLKFDIAENEYVDSEQGLRSCEPYRVPRSVIQEFR
ncbi:unnamed protein product [Sympodiomycopsis kandeliae]